MTRYEQIPELVGGALAPTFSSVPITHTIIKLLVRSHAHHQQFLKPAAIDLTFHTSLIETLFPRISQTSLPTQAKHILRRSWLMQRDNRRTCRSLFSVFMPVRFTSSLIVLYMKLVTQRHGSAIHRIQFQILQDSLVAARSTSIVTLPL